MAGGIGQDRNKLMGDDMLKKAVMAAVLCVLALPALASAQATVQATATVADYSQLTGTDVLDFGTLSRVTNAVINAAGGASSATRSLSYNHNVTITYQNVPTSLTATVNGNGVSLPVALTCAYRVGAGSWSAESACGSASFALDVTGAITSATLGFGGSILAADVTTRPAATYTGQFNVVITAR